MYADLPNVAGDLLSISPHGVGVEWSFSPKGDVIGGRQSKASGYRLQETVNVTQIARTTNGISAANDPALDMTNTEDDSDMKTDGEQQKLQRLGNVHNFERCGTVAKTYVLYRRNLALHTHRGQW